MNISKNKTTKNKAIKIKLTNLIASTPNDVCVKTKINNFCFDISKYFSFDELNDFMQFGLDKLSLSATKSKQVLQDELDACATPTLFLNYLSENDIFLSKTRIEKINKNFEKYKQETINIIVSKSSGQRRKIDGIIKKNKIISDNTGIYSLYIGTMFIYGKTKQGTIINAPLLFMPIEMTSRSEYYDIQLASGFNDNLIVNEKLISLLLTEYGVNLSILDLINECKQTNSFAPLVNALNKILDASLSFDDVPNHEFEENIFIESINKFHLVKSYVCGIFEPTGGALKYDLEQLIKLNVDPFASSNEMSKTHFVNEEINGMPLTTIGRPLNIYQKYAIRSALKQNTIIFGPPGTGKSEVICNLIANVLLKNKTVLLAAEKRIALDVIMERLGGLSKYALYIGDLKNKNDFYTKILSIADRLENVLLSSEAINVSKETLEETQSLKIHEQLKHQFNELKSLNNKIDSAGTTFNEYLALLKQIDKRTLRFVKENDSLSLLKRIVYMYSFKSIDNFFQKMNEYRNFLMAHKIPSTNAKLLQEQKIQIINFDINYNFLVFLRENQQDINLLVRNLTNFLVANKLSTNKHFMNNLRKRPTLLKEQLIGLNVLRGVSSFFNREMLQFMIDNSSKIESFITKISKNSRSQIVTELFNNFVNSSKMYKYVDPFKFDSHEQSALECIKLFNKFLDIPSYDSQYLLKLLELKNPTIIDQNVILMYFNPWLMQSYVLELGENSFTFFDNKDIVEFAAISHISSAEYRLIEKVLNYENEIIESNKALSVNLRPMISEYRYSLKHESENASELISDLYLNMLKLKISKLDDKTKQRIKEIFSIAKRDLKNNVPIKELIVNYYNEFKIIFPIWISLPELIAQVLPLQKAIFDYGIFDEASQIFMERAYPIIYRCGINIVAGDDKQLKPTSFFAIRVNDATQDYEYADNDQVDSLLDRAKVALWPAYHLRNHYRSMHRDLIQFSNDYIYNNNLYFVSKNGIIDHAIETINVDGAHEEGVNKAEAEVVFQQLIENIDRYQKIIVVTFGIKQSLYIEQLIYRNAHEYSRIYTKLIDGDLVVCSLESVQGNEGDLVILSVTYGRDALGTFRANFGPIFMDGGSNRLNVAITRAKDKMIIVKSFYSKEMIVNMNNPNARVFYDFISYCDRLEEKTHQLATIKTIEQQNSLITNDVNQIIERYLENNPHYYLVRNYDIGSKVIDFAILDKNTNVTKLAIIINKLSTKITVQDLFETIDHCYFVNDRGYPTYLLDEYYWIHNDEQSINELKQRLANL